MDGPSTTRNAIRLLEQMDFPETVTQRADNLAARFTDTGSWDNNLTQIPWNNPPQRRNIMSNAFMHQDFLLTTTIARTLYHTHAKPMPIIDYHCHIDPRQIAEDHVFRDLTEAWLGGDHYKWRVMRANGVEDASSPATPRPEKFEAWANPCQG